MMEPSELAALARMLTAKILVVDDDPFIQGILQRYLRELDGDTVVVASDGLEALEILSKQKIIAVITDFSMPGADGIELLQRIRTGLMDIPRGLPVIMLTGFSDLGVVSRAIALDVDAFVLKPISKETLWTRLRQVLSTPRDLKSVEAYERIVANASAPAALLRRRQINRTGGRFVGIDEVPATAILAEDIMTPAGELLMNAGIQLNVKLIGYLRDLRNIGVDVGAIYIE